MNCKSVRKLLPLYIESDLPAEKKGKVQIHIESCLDCQKEYEAYAQSINAAKEWLRESAVTWSDMDWKRTVRNAASEKTETSSGFAPWPFRKGWAFALMGAVVVVLVFFVTRPLFLGIEDFSAQTTLAKRHPQHQEGSTVKSPQDVVSMTMVSKETGLKVVWVLNRNFNLEENK
jgi:hypothetical protein